MYYYELIDLENEIQEQLSPHIKSRGFCNKDEFLKICKWKTRRTQSRCKSNDESLIEEVTKMAFGSEHEEIKISIFTLLTGVNMPTASVFLHFCHNDPYPILDFRALWSLGITQRVSYNFQFWWEYVCYCRMLAKQLGLKMRDLDKALWSYSKKTRNKQ